MIGLTNKGAVICLSIFLGLVFFGVSIALTNFNRLVEPQHPRQLLTWQKEKGQQVISLLGENLSFQLDQSLPDRLARQASEQAKPVMDELQGHTGIFKKEISTLKEDISAGQWLEQAVSAARAAQALLLEFRERLQWWLDRYWPARENKTAVFTA